MHKERIDKRIKRRFQNLRLSGKLLVIYILAGFLPIMITLTITYHEMKKILWDRETMILESYLTQTTDALDNELEIYNNLSNYISYNQSIAKILSSDQSTYQNYEQVASVIDPLLSSIMYFHDDVKQVTIYTDACQVKHGSTIAPITTIENEETDYGIVDDNQIHWIVNAKDKTAYSLNRMAMLEQKKAKGLLYVGVDYDSVFQPFNNETVFDNYGVVIEDAEGNCIFKKSVFTEEKQPYELSEEQFFATVGQKDSGYQFIKRESKASGWKIWIYKPDRLIISSIQPILIIAAAAILVSLIAAVACIRIISEFITKRISKLQKKADRKLITSKLDGIVTTVGDAATGTNSESDSFMIVKSKDGYYVQGTVGELMLDQVKEGTILNCNSYGENGYMNFEAEVIQVSDYAVDGDSSYYYYGDSNPNVSSYNFTAKITDDTVQVSVGDWVDIQLEQQAQSTDGIVLSKAFVRTEDGVSYVYKDDNGVLKKQIVKVKENVNGGAYVLVSGGLSMDDKIAFPYSKSIKEGMKTKEGSLDTFMGYDSTSYGGLG